ncbi:Salicylic acid-binding protein 2 [Bienertia sinuspersici]
MEMFPHKIEIAVFVTAFMPDTQHPPSFILEQFGVRMPEGGKDYWLDTESKCIGDDPKEALTTMLFGHNSYPSFTTYLQPRTSSLFLHDLWKQEKKFSKEKYGSVRCVYVVCEEDRGIPQDFQRWMIENYGLKEVKELKGSDHMPMLSIPKQLSDCLLEITHQ